MEIAFRELATAQSSNLFSDNMRKVLGRPGSPIGKIKECIIPDYGIRRHAAVILSIGASRCNRILWSLMGANLKVADYNRIIPHMGHIVTDGFRAPGILETMGFSH